ncbi:MAG: hypothetical protein OXN84_18390, partial [Albidovulum sp.]|nr:hypothetical protein [Albidovulum sp.]
MAQGIDRKTIRDWVARFNKAAQDGLTASPSEEARAALEGVRGIVRRPGFRNPSPSPSIRRPDPPPR